MEFNNRSRECRLDALVFPFSMLIKHHNLSRWFELMIARNSVQFTSQNHAEHFIEHVQERGFFTQFGRTVYISKI